MQEIASEKIAQIALENSGLGYFHLVISTGVMTYSATYSIILTGKEKIGYTHREFLQFLHPDDAQARSQAYAKAETTGRVEYEARSVWEDGSIHWMHIRGTFLTDSNGVRVILTGTLDDVTEAYSQRQALAAREAMFRNVTNSSPAGLWLSDDKGAITYLNQRMLEWTGLSADAIKGDGWLSIIADEDKTTTQNNYITAIRDRTHLDNIFRLRKKNGTTSWCRAAGDPYYTDDGRFAGFAGYCLDIDEMVLITRELEAGEAKFRSIIEQAPLAIAMLRSRDMIIEVGNDRIFEFWGQDKSYTGKKLAGLLTDNSSQASLHVLQTVYDTSQAAYGHDLQKRLYREGKEQDHYFDFAYTPLLNVDGSVTGVMVVGVEVTDQVKARKLVEEDQARFRSLVEEAPVATCLFVGNELIVEVANDAMISLWGKSAKIIGMPLEKAVPELKGQPFIGILQGLLKSGETYSAEGAYADLEVNGTLQGFYFDFTYKPLRNADGEVYAIMEMAVDVTEKVIASQRLMESESKFRSLMLEAPFATALYAGRELIIETANTEMIKLWGKDHQVINQPLHLALPELEGQDFLEILDEVYTSGNTYNSREAEVRLATTGGGLRTGYFNFTYKPLLDNNGKVYAILNMAVDVTEQVMDRRKIEESELFSRSVFHNSPVAKLVFVGEEMIIKTINENMLQLLDRDETIIGKPMLEALPELQPTQQMQNLLQVYHSGETFHQPEEKVLLMKGGELHTGYYDYIYKPLYDTYDKIYGIMVTATEVTLQVQTRQTVEIAEYNLRSAIALAKLGTWSIDIATRRIEYSDRLRHWFGFTEDEEITVDRAYEPVLETDRARVKTFFMNTSTLVQNATSDIEFTVSPGGNHKERIIQSQGQCFYDGNGQPYRISGTARDVTTQRKLQLALEQQVQQRTEELQSVNEELTATNEELFESNKRLTYSNEELAQYAYVASHDLQEPLRKIRMFSDMLDKKPDLPPANRELVDKINRSAERMSTLIENLLDFSRLLKSDMLMNRVDLNLVAAEVKSDFELVIQEKKAAIHIGKLAVINAIGLQMNQLFYNLISNALKFTRPGVAPVINITGRELTDDEAREHIIGPVHHDTYYHILVSDNGIGIESQYSDQIFEVFKRLHRREIYPGSGIGLALCRRIVTNHDGYIYFESEIDKGSTFHILLPSATLQ